MVRVPMVVAVGYTSIIDASLWECFSWITILIPLLALIVTLAPLRMKSRWAWRIPLLSGIFVLICGIGMAAQLWIQLYLRNGIVGFDPTGIAMVILLGLVLLAESFVSRQIIRRRTSLLEGRCLKCGYDLRATPDRCPECGCIPPTRILKAGTP